MNIIIISQYYFPEQFQINEIAPELVKRGHEVTVLCGVPNYPQGKIFEGYEDDSKLEEIKDGVRIIRVKQKPRGNNILTLIRNYFSFVKEGNKAIKSLVGDFDVVIGYQLSPITSMIPAVKFAQQHKIPLLLYVLDIWPVSGQSHLPIKTGLVFHWLKRISKKIYNAADRILVSSRPFIDYLKTENGIEINKLEYLPQHADEGMLEKDFRREKSETVNFMYAGNLGKGSTLEVIIKAAKELGKRNDYKIHFVGNGSQRKNLEGLVKDYNLEGNIIFQGAHTRQKMPEFYKMADALLITLRGNNAVGDTMPGKLQMYMTTGKPILGAINGAAKEVIEESKCGRCVKAGDYKGLSELMDDFINRQENYTECGKNAQEYFKKNFTLEKFMDGLEKSLEELSSNTL